MKRPILVALAATALVVGGVLTATPAHGLGKVKCDAHSEPTVAVGSYDPIVNHNEPSSAHEHQFFGSTALHSLANPNEANYSDLVGQATNCRAVLGLAGSADSAAYWIPTLRYKSGPNAGQLVPVQQFTAYYRSADGKKFGPAVAIPADARLIGTKSSWSCGVKSGSRSRLVQSIPDCSGLSGKPGRTLTAKIDFPSCWDGVSPTRSADDVGDTRDNAHYAYRVGKTCPEGFPIGVVELRETVQFAYTGSGDDVELSSDAASGSAPGGSLHGDFWNTWRQPQFEKFVATCVVSTASYNADRCDP